MIEIQRRLKINNYENKDYIVYPEDEYKGKYKHWKECKPSEWGISDDGYIAQCIAVNTYASGVEMTYCYGKQWITKTSKLLFIPHWENKSFHGTSTKSHMDLELQKTRSKNVLDAYVAYIMTGKKPDFVKLGQMYRPDQERPDITVKRLLKTKGMKQMIKDKMKDVLTERGIDEGYVLDTIKDAIGVAKVNEDPGNMIKAAKELSDYLDMKPKMKTQTDTLEMDLSHQISANFDKQTKKLTATKTQELPDEGQTNNIGKEKKS